MQYTIASKLAGPAQDIIFNYDAQHHSVTASFTVEQLIALYRRLPIYFSAHDYELTPSTLLSKVLAECMQHAYKQKVNAETTEQPLSSPVASDMESGIAYHRNDHSGTYDLHIYFYNTIFTALDALADLEEMVNEFHDGAIDKLHTALTSYDKKMQDIFDNLQNQLSFFISHEHQSSFKNHVTICSDDVRIHDVTGFRKNINDNKDPKNLTALLSAYNRNNQIMSLGEFIISQVKRIQDLLVSYHRLQEHFIGQEDFIETSAAMKALKVLRADSFAFQESCAGVEYTSGQPYSSKIITFLRLVGGNQAVSKEAKYTVVLNDFIAPEKQYDLNEWEKLFAAIVVEKPKMVGYANAGEAVYYTFAIIAMSIIEVAVTVFLRFPVNFLVGFFLATLQAMLKVVDLLPFVHHAFFNAAQYTNAERVEKITRIMDDWHHAATVDVGLSAFRRERDYEQIKRYNQAKNLHNDARTQLIMKITAKTKSSVACTAAEAFSPELVYKKVLRGYESIGEFFYTPTVRDPHYVVEKITYHFQPEKQPAVLAKLLQDLQARGHAIPDALYLLAGCEAPKAPESEVIDNPIVPRADHVDAVSTAADHQVDTCMFIRASDLVIHVHPAQSIMNFAVELALEFSSLINRIFVKLPLASTLAQLFAFVAFGVAYMGMSGPLPTLLNDLSLVFTGSSTVESDARKMIAAFLLWKITVVGIEAIFALFKLDLNFLKRLYGDPERIFLGLTTFLGLGLLIQLFPLLPETINLFSRGISGILFGMYPQSVKDFCNAVLGIYPGIVNLFIIEAREAWHGQIPLNFLEYFFLGLKSAFLLRALVSGYHEPHFHANPQKFAQLIKELNVIAVPAANSFIAAEYVIALYDAAGLQMNRNAAQHLYDILSKSNSVSVNILNGLYNDHIFKGSNNLLQILFLLPGFFMTYLYRAVKYGIGKVLSAPVMQHEVIKNICEDMVMFTSVATALGENFRSFILSVNQLFKFVLAFCLGVPLHLLGLVAFKDFNQGLQKTFDMENHLLWASKGLSTPCCALVHNPYSFKSVYGVVAHQAGNEKFIQLN